MRSVHSQVRGKEEGGMIAASHLMSIHMPHIAVKLLGKILLSRVRGEIGILSGHNGKLNGCSTASYGGPSCMCQWVHC